MNVKNMKKRRWTGAAQAAGAAAFLVLTCALVGCPGTSEETAPSNGEGASKAEAQAPAGPGPNEPLLPLPERVDDVDPAKVEIGQRLYFDGMLSVDGSVSCAACHSFSFGGADGRAASIGVKGQRGPISAPTVLNARYHIAQFWDGRAKDLQEQAEGPVANPKEMGETWENVVSKVAADPWYKARFEKHYGGEVSKGTITNAIAEYEKTLVTPAPFDRYLRGEVDAISEEARAGYALFKEVGCVTCHNGIAVGGSMFQKMGLVEDYFALRGGEITEADLGRYNVTRNEAEKHVFKVPSLRNVALTAPYFHDGWAKTLEDAIRTMARVQLGKKLSDAQVQKIKAFLESLTGELPETAKAPEGFDRAVTEPLPEPN